MCYFSPQNEYFKTEKIDSGRGLAHIHYVVKTKCHLTDTGEKLAISLNFQLKFPNCNDKNSHKINENYCNSLGQGLLF
jgi:hypothetical protein